MQVTQHQGVPANAKILLVDDHPLLAQSLTISLRADGIEVERCELSENGIIGAVETNRPDVVLLDLELGGELGSSLPLVSELVDRDALVVMLTGVEDRVRLAECVEAGAVGIIAKSESFDQLLTGIQRVTEHGSLLSYDERQTLLAELRQHRAADRQRVALFEQLTPRERQVLAGLMDGQTAEQIAQRWVVSVTTVRSQIRSLLTKLDVNSQLSAVAAARKSGWNPHSE